MDITDLIQMAKTLSPIEKENLLRSMRTKRSIKKTIKTATKHVPFKLKIDSQNFQQSVNGNDIIKHFMEEIIPNVKYMPPYAIKSNIVGMFEMLAEVEEDSNSKNKWRQKASKVASIGSQENLFSYVANLATGISMKSYA